jgi:signal peptidase I
MIELGVWLVLLAALLAGNVLGLRFLPNTFGLKPVSWIQAVGGVALVATAAGTILATGFLLGPRLPIPWYATTAATIVLVAAAGLTALRVTLWVDWMASLRAALIMMVVLGGVGTVAVIPLRLSYEAFKIPTNAMAPTLKGRHYVGSCIYCGQSTVVGFRDQGRFSERQANSEGICTACLQVSPATSVIEQVQMGDRMIARKLASPRRWDLVIFRFPGDRNVIYVKRLVGLPGESIEVKDGAIWIDGERLQPPPEIAELKWFLPEDGFGAQFAVEGEPPDLGDDEYFVLGDFSPSSSDSRFWGPVPEEDLLGVVGVIYFPPRSWKVLPRH